MRFRLLRQKSVFLIGFGIGFVFPLLLSLWRTISVIDRTYDQEWLPKYYLDNKPHREEIILQHWKEEKRTFGYFNNVTYNAWLAAQNVKLYKINLDEYVYGPKEKEKEKDGEKTENVEWIWLSNQVSVTCVIFVEKLKLAKSIRDTWSKRCNNVYFFGYNKVQDAQLPIININAKIVSSWQLLCEVMNYIWNDMNKLEWIIFVKDNTMVVPENLRYIVAPLNYTDDYYLGHPVVLWGQPYNIAQSGYVLSKGALAKVVQMFNTSEKCIKSGKYWKKEDYYLGKHLSSLGIYPSDTRDQYLRGTFHGYSLQNLLWGVNHPDNYWTQAIYPTKRACSPISVTFSTSEADKMFTLNYLLYNLHVFIGENRFGNASAKVSIPEEDVWKFALEEEFNITHLSDISSEIYYEIWHSKYSEPRQLKIAENNRMASNALKYLLKSVKVKDAPMKNCTTTDYYY